MFIKFICNVWVCQYHGFTWSYHTMTCICINMLALIHIELMFHFRTLKTLVNCMVFWRFQAVKNRILVQEGLRTYLILLSHCKPMCYFLPFENIWKLLSFLKFSGVKKWNIGLIWDTSVTVISLDYYEHSSSYCYSVHVKVVISLVVKRKITRQ